MPAEESDKVREGFGVLCFKWGGTMKIAVISDTHNLLREEVGEQLKTCDLILHAGDICSPDVYDALVCMGKPMLIVRGNNDGKWAKEKKIPDVVNTAFLVPGDETLKTGQDRLNLFMVHDRRDIPKTVLADGGGYDLVVFGHSHKYESFCVGKTLFVNPGSCGPVRFRLPVSMAVVEVPVSAAIDSDVIKVHQINLTEAKQNSEEREVSPGEMKMLVMRVVKDIKHNKSAEYIAKKHKISLELSEQICRLYLTHPGVTVDGILGKMGM